MAGTETQLRIRSEADIVNARRVSREISVEAGLQGTDIALVATAVSELARNILQYAGMGEMSLRLVQRGKRQGICVIAHDDGPGIANVELAMRDGYSTGGGLGLGLPGTRRMMDEFDLQTEAGAGTTVTACKWNTLKWVSSDGPR